MTRGAVLSGRVLSDRGEPIANAVVCCNGVPMAGGRGTTRSDEQGAFELRSVRQSGNELWAWRPGWAAGRVAVVIPEPEAVVADLDIVMTRGFELRGRVLDESGGPIVGAEVCPEGVGINDRGRYVGGSAYSSGDGSFHLQHLTRERIGLRVFALGFVNETQIVEVGSDVVVRPTPAGGLAGHVVDGLTGAPIDSFVVRYVAPKLAPGERRVTSYGVEWSRAGMSFAGTGGNWSSGPEQLAVGSVTGVEVSAAGYASTVLEHVVVAQAPQPEELRIELYKGVTLRGFVVDKTSGEPLGDARIRRANDGDSQHQRYTLDEDCGTRTDDEGRFTLESVPLGSMYLVVDEAELPLYVDGPFEVVANATTLERTIAVSSGGRLVGHYLDGAARPLVGQTVAMTAMETPGGTRPRYEVETDSAGAFEFERLSAGVYHLVGTVTQPGTSAPVGAGLLRLVQVEDGRTLECDLRPTGSATVSGTVEYDGELPPGVRVELIPKQVPGGAWGRWHRLRRPARGALPRVAARARSVERECIRTS